MKTCTWPGCDRPMSGRGLCNVGYQRVHQNGWIDHDTPVRPPTPDTCTWPGCNRAHKALGLCALAYKRVRQLGWIDHDTPAIVIPDVCTWPGCTEPHSARGLCSRGYARVHTQGWPDHDTPRHPPKLDTCTWPGCDEPHLALGLCVRGYARVHTNGWIDHDTPPAQRALSSSVYLIHHRNLNAVKIGIGGQVRLGQHRTHGWVVVNTWDFDTPDEARQAERRVLDLWEGWTGYLTADQMPQHGWTETIDARVYDAAAVQFALAG